MGQLSKLLNMKFLIATVTLNKIQGLPFRSIEIAKKIDELA
jgi:hypothetical protein